VFRNEYYHYDFCAKGAFKYHRDGYCGRLGLPGGRERLALSPIPIPDTGIQKENRMDTKKANGVVNAGQTAFDRFAQAVGDVRGTSTDALWPLFVDAVAAANAELAEREAAGFRRWQEARHQESGQ